jgi:hypothetical protein
LLHGGNVRGQPDSPLERKGEKERRREGERVGGKVGRDNGLVLNAAAKHANVLCLCPRSSPPTPL